MRHLGATHLLLIISVSVARATGVSCNVGSRAAAATNAASLATIIWTPFKRTETGWAIYAPLIAQEIGVSCPPDSPGFAAGLASWQKNHKEAGTGVLDEATFEQMKLIWELKRPFVLQSRAACPPPPDESALVRAAAKESYGGEQISLRPETLAAYRRLVTAARAALPALAADPQLLTIFSGYRSPQSDAARCQREQNCQGGARAICSAHRTGSAIDLYLGSAPGFRPDSSADANRLYLSRSAAYLWLVHNAARFGFVNYPFEPWHWEWTGASSSPS